MVNNTTTTVDPQILKGTGGMDTATAAADRRAANIKFVTIETTIDFTIVIGDDNSKFKVSTVIELPMTSKQVNDTASGAIEVAAFQGKADIRTYSSDDFQDHIINVMGQTGAAKLVAPAFGASMATLDNESKADELHELVVGKCFGYLSQQLFKTVCANLAYRPAQTLDNVKQVHDDANGNKVRIPMNDFFNKILNASATLSPDNFEVDLVTHAMDSMDPDGKTHLEDQYTGHLGARKRDKVTQIRTLQAL